MSETLDRCTAWLGEPNCRAFLRVIREGESGQGDDAYTIINGGSHFTAPPWRHPWYGIPTPRAKASGAYQELGTTAKGCDEALGLDQDFSPVSQDLHAVYLIAEHGAMADVLRGHLAGAMARLATTWVSLPGLGFERARRVFVNYGGTPADGSTAAPEGAGTTQPAPEVATTQGGSMGPLIPIFGAVLAQLLPQVGVLFGGQKDARNAQVLSTVLDTVVKTATGDPNAKPTVATVGAAIEAMQADPKVHEKVQQAVVTQPEVMGALELVEVGGGAAGAREADLKARADERPFWKTSAVFWVSVLLLPLVYWLVGSLIVGGVAIPDTWPAWVQAPFKLFGTAWNGESRSGGFNLVIGLVLGGICGVYFGVSVTQAKQGQAAQPPREA